MYTPKHFQNTNNEEILAFIQANSFGTLITTDEKILATHIPLEIDPTGKLISGHISAANPQASHLTDGKDVMCIFLGPHAYISSSWYNHENVPTWNYIAIHVYGKARLTTGEETISSLRELMDKYEAASQNPASLDGLSKNYVSKAINGIVAFKIDITSIKASYKLSQNRDEANHKRIVDQLEKRDGGDDKKIAFEMKKRSPKI